MKVTTKNLELAMLLIDVFLAILVGFGMRETGLSFYSGALLSTFILSAQLRILLTLAKTTSNFRKLMVGLMVLSFIEMAIAMWRMMLLPAVAACFLFVIDLAAHSVATDVIKEKEKNKGLTIPARAQILKDAEAMDTIGGVPIAPESREKPKASCMRPLSPEEAREVHDDPVSGFNQLPLWPSVHFLPDRWRRSNGPRHWPWNLPWWPR